MKSYTNQTFNYSFNNTVNSDVNNTDSTLNIAHVNTSNISWPIQTTKNFSGYVNFSTSLHDQSNNDKSIKQLFHNDNSLVSTLNTSNLNSEKTASICATSFDDKSLETSNYLASTNKSICEFELPTSAAATSTRVNSDSNTPKDTTLLTAAISNKNINSSLGSTLLYPSIFTGVIKTEAKNVNISETGSKSINDTDNQSFIGEFEPFKETVSLSHIKHTLARSFNELSSHELGYSRKDIAHFSCDHIQNYPSNHHNLASLATVTRVEPNQNLSLKKSSYTALLKKYNELIIKNVIKDSVTSIYEEQIKQIQVKKSCKKRKINFISDFKKIWFYSLITNSKYKLYDVSLSEKANYYINSSLPWCKCVIVFDSLIHTPMLQSYITNTNNLMHMMYIKLFHSEVNSAEQCYLLNYRSNYKTFYGYRTDYNDADGRIIKSKITFEDNNNTSYNFSNEENTFKSDFINSKTLNSNHETLKLIDNGEKNLKKYILGLQALSIYDIMDWSESTQEILKNSSCVIFLLSGSIKRATHLFNDTKDKINSIKSQLNPSYFQQPSETYLVIFGAKSMKSRSSSLYNLYIDSINISCDSLHLLCEKLLEWAFNSSFWISKPTTTELSFFINDFNKKMYNPLCDLVHEYRNKINWLFSVEQYIQNLINEYLTTLQDSFKRNIVECIAPCYNENDYFSQLFLKNYQKELMTTEQYLQLKYMANNLDMIKVPPLIHTAYKKIDECQNEINHFIENFAKFCNVILEYPMRRPTLSSIKKEMIYQSCISDHGDMDQFTYFVTYVPFFIDLYPSIFTSYFVCNANCGSLDEACSDSINLSIVLPFSVVRDVKQRVWPFNLIEDFKNSDFYCKNIHNVSPDISKRDLLLKHIEKIQIEADYIENELKKIFSSI